MNIQLINTPNEDWSAVQQILFNRGLSLDRISNYLNLTKENVNSPLALGEENLKAGASAIADAIYHEDKAVVIVDCDCDGYTSAALLINYLYCHFPIWVKSKVDWIMHKDKSHGLNDHLEDLLESDYSLIICPDGASNDYKAHRQLKDKGKTILILDHHLADYISKDAIVINNQLSGYPNKQLAGVGVVWQFCCYLDSLLNSSFAWNFVDLVALGLVGDMMSLLEDETRFLITEGFKKENIKNPFIDYIIDRNSFPLSKSDYKSGDSAQACTGIGAAFFIVPFINAITRSGTLEEKDLIFKSMLNHFAFERVPEVKRNKETGKLEPLVMKAIRTVVNVKNRQTKTEKTDLEKIEKIIKEKDLIEKHNVLVLLLKNITIASEIRGLLANKLMAKYQRPCMVLSLTNHNTYEGSMRGYTKKGIKNFKSILEKCPQVNWVQGHPNAAGVSIQADKIETFLEQIDSLLAKYSTELSFDVDYYFKDNLTNHEKDIVCQIANLNDLWGQDIERAKVAINFKVTENNFTVMKANTLKINLPNQVSLIKFGGTEEDIASFTTKGWKEFQAICKCNINEWNGEIYPQLMIEEYEMTDYCNFLF